MIKVIAQDRWIAKIMTSYMLAVLSRHLMTSCHATVRHLMTSLLACYHQSLHWVRLSAHTVRLFLCEKRRTKRKSELDMENSHNRDTRYCIRNPPDLCIRHNLRQQTISTLISTCIIHLQRCILFGRQIASSANLNLQNDIKPTWQSKPTESTCHFLSKIKSH
jgi:hypothetical protein